MLAFIYLGLMIIVGDFICRRYYPSVSWSHRLAASFLGGLVLSSWFTYLSSLAFARTANPLLWGNLLFFGAAIGLLIWWRRGRANEVKPAARVVRALRTDRWDLITIGLLVVFVSWMMFSTLSMDQGKLQVANHEWSDFGPNIAIMQSFAMGHNFPTEYPHFSGDRIRYHFLFYFQAGNLEYLGLNAALSNNILSVMSLVAMLALVMTLGEVLFKSKAVGRLGAALFFFHGSLSYILFLRNQRSLGKAVSTAASLPSFLPTGFPYRGEDWGVWSLVNFLNQRHFAGAIGILLLVVIFLVSQYQTCELESDPALLPAREGEASSSGQVFGQSWREKLAGMVRATFALEHTHAEMKSPNYAGFLFSGCLLGLLPLWNGAVFIAAVAVLTVFFFLFPRRKQMLALAAATAVMALPQVLYLRTGNVRKGAYSLFHWGYTIDQPTIVNVTKYLVVTFGFKWLLIGVALYFATRSQRKVFLAASSLIAVAFCFQFSEEVLANHKFLNMWLIVANLFVAYGLSRVWRLSVFGANLPGRLAAATLIVLVTMGGVIDLFPIRNSYWVEVPFEGDRLVSWIREQTDPKAVFLSDRFVTHRILLAGRRVFQGYTYFTWSAGYLAAERDEVYKHLFEEQNPQELFRLLRENNISYVAIDNGVRHGGFIKNVNEAVYQATLEKVFRDDDHLYDELAIYKVPKYLRAPVSPPAAPTPVAESSPDSSSETNLPAVNALAGGQGNGRGQFEHPRGLAVDQSGNLYVADTGNARIQKFSPAGEFLVTFGKRGKQAGELEEPNGIAVDSLGNVFVVDAANHKLLKFGPDGNFLKEWRGPEPGFYGPRDLALGANDRLYIVDQGRTRIVTFDPASEQFSAWGGPGGGEGQFLESTGIAIGGGFVFVSDTGNGRIQVFDLEGRFVRQWEVKAWGKYAWNRPDAACDAEAKRLYVTSGLSKEVLVFDTEGKFLSSRKSGGPEDFSNATALALFGSEKEKRLYVLDTGADTGFTGTPRISMFKLTAKSK